MLKRVFGWRHKADALALDRRQYRITFVGLRRLLVERDRIKSSFYLIPHRASLCSCRLAKAWSCLRKQLAAGERSRVGVNRTHAATHNYARSKGDSVIARWRGTRIP